MTLTYNPCALCPRQCGADRAGGATGFCGMTARPRVARAAPHFGEEPCISGTRGSGTVFFSGCGLGCGYCQNHQISLDGGGREVEPEALRGIFQRLAAQGVHNLSLVTATQFLPSILPALRPGLGLPVVYNTGGYERVETVQALERDVDVWLPDLKYADGALAKQCSRAEDYFPVATAAIRQMVRQTGRPVFNAEGLLVRGVLVRHLVLPGQLENTLKCLDWLAETFPNGEVLVSLMGQYTPLGPLAKQPPFDRTVTEEEYAGALSWMELLELEGYSQDLTAATTELLPAFDETGVTV